MLTQELMHAAVQERMLQAAELRRQAQARAARDQNGASCRLWAVLRIGRRQRPPLTEQKLGAAYTP